MDEILLERKPPMKENVFIVIDGPDGAGKSTVIKRVYEQLLSEGLSVILTREPGGSSYAEKIRELILSDDAHDADPLAMLYLFNAARMEHIEKTIRPALEKNIIVICDRFDSTTFAYQVRASERPDLASLFGVLRMQYQAVLPYYILLDVPPEIGRARMQNREKQNHFDQRDASFHERARGGFKDFLSGFCKPDGFAIIDATPTPDMVFEATLAKVKLRIGDIKP